MRALESAPLLQRRIGQNALVDLSAVPAGDHEISLIAWAPDASAKPVSLRLPPIKIHALQGE